jgi:predicted aspartyl protease
MQLTLREGLMYADLGVTYKLRDVRIPNVVIDTGSARTVLSADWLAKVGVVPEPYDTLYTVRGIGGTEVVFARQIDQLHIGPVSLADIEIEVGGLDYGFELNGILGVDLLRRSQAIIDMATLELTFKAGADDTG